VQPKKGKASGGRQRWRPPLKLIGVLAFAAAAVAVVLIVISKSPQGPQPIGVGDEAQRAVPEASDLAFREETFAVARQLMTDFPASAYPIGLMGTVYNQFGNSEEAEKWWRECLERDPNRTDVYEVLAVAFLRKGEYEKVAELLSKAQEIDANLPHVHRRYAEALLEMGKLDEALAAIEKEMTISPELSETHLLLAKIYLQRQDYEKAVAAYSQALRLKPGDSRCYYGLATASARLGQSDKAREYMETFSKLRADEDEVSTTRRMATDKMRQAPQVLAETLIDAGRVYEGYRQFQKAEEYWQRAAALDSTNTICRAQLLNLYKRTGRRQEALEVCGQLTKIDPDNAFYELLTGVVLAELKRYDVAEETIRRAIKLAPENAGGYRSLAEVLLLQNHKLPEAKTLAQKSVDLEPTARHYSLLSQACMQNQDRVGALAAMKRATELAPDSEDMRRAYERLQEGQ